MIAKLPTVSSIPQLIPLEVMSHLPWLDQVSHCEDGPEEYTNSSDNDVCNAQERISSTHDRPGGNDQRFSASVFGDGKDY